MKVTWDEIYQRSGEAGAIGGLLSGKKVQEIGNISYYLEQKWHEGEGVLNYLHIAKDSHLLDLGCGSAGTMVIPAIKKGINVTGIDISNIAIALLKRRIKLLKKDKSCTLLVQNLTSDFPFANHFFDYITCLGVVMHVNLQQFLSEISRVIKPGGKVYINCFLNKFHPSNIQYTLFQKLGFMKVPFVVYGWGEILNLYTKYFFKIKTTSSFHDFPRLLSYHFPYPSKLIRNYVITRDSITPFSSLAREWVVLATRH